MLKRIHINQHKIRANAKHGTNEPVITCKTSKSNIYGHSVEIYHEDQVVATIKYQPNKPLACGAKVWIETKNLCLVYDEDENGNVGYEEVL